MLLGHDVTITTATIHHYAAGHEWVGMAGYMGDGISGVREHGLLQLRLACKGVWKIGLPLPGFMTCTNYRYGYECQCQHVFTLDRLFSWFLY